MLQSFETAVPNQAISAYSFEISGSVNRKNALYRQVVANAGLRPGQVLLELSFGIENPVMTATIHEAENEALGGVSRVMETITIEEPFENNHPDSVFPWNPGSFDTIICMGIVNQLSNPAKLLTYVQRLLSAEGKLILADQWFRDAGPMFANLLQPYRQSPGNRIYSPCSVIRLLRRSGFGLIEIRPAGTTNFFCIATAIK